jgi:hypothetical protein
MRLIENRFTQYELDKNEEYMGAILTDMQIAYIRNQMAEVANQYMTLTSNTPSDDITYFRLLQYLRGKMDAFEGLLLMSEALKNNMNQELQEELNNQPQFKRG